MCNVKVFTEKFAFLKVSENCCIGISIKHLSVALEQGAFCEYISVFCRKRFQKRLGDWRIFVLNFLRKSNFITYWVSTVLVSRRANVKLFLPIDCFF
jgi:hypothetical protein